MAQAMVDRSAGKLPGRRGARRLTVLAWAEEWHASNVHLRDSSRSAQIFDMGLLGSLGGQRIELVTTLHVRRWRDGLIGEGYAPAL